LHPFRTPTTSGLLDRLEQLAIQEGAQPAVSPYRDGESWPENIARELGDQGATPQSSLSKAGSRGARIEVGNRKDQGVHRNTTSLTSWRINKMVRIGNCDDVRVTARSRSERKDLIVPLRSKNLAIPYGSNNECSYVLMNSCALLLLSAKAKSTYPE